jgi:hypothetical protein
MKTYTFTLTLTGVDALTPQVSDALFEAGINGDEDTLVYSRDGLVRIDYEIESPTLADAVASAIGKVERAGYGVARVEVEEPAAIG